MRRLDDDIPIIFTATRSTVLMLSTQVTILFPTTNPNIITDPAVDSG